VGLFAAILVHVLLGLPHLSGGRPAGPRSRIGTQLGEPLELPLEILADLGLLLGQALELLAALFGVGVVPGLARLPEVLGLARPGLGELVLRILELLDQAGQLPLPAVLNRVDQIAHLVPGLLLPRARRAHLIAFELLGGLTQLPGCPLFLALIGRL